MVVQPEEFAGSCCFLEWVVIFVIGVTGTAQEAMHVEFAAVMFWQLGEYCSIFPELLDETSP